VGDIRVRRNNRPVPLTMRGAAATFLLADDGSGIDLNITQK
jgi:hypothetical protein